MWHKLQVHTLPCGVFSERLSLLLPLRHISLQHFVGCVGFFQTFGGQHFNALCEQHGRFSLHHHLVLQIFNRFDLFVELLLEPRQRFTRQGRTCFGGITLPSHGIGNVHAGRRQHGRGTFGPFCGQDILAVNAFELV